MPDELQQPFHPESNSVPAAAAAAAAVATAAAPAGAAMADSVFASQPLPAMQRAFSRGLHADFGSAPISPFAEHAQQRRSSASSVSRASRSSAGRGSLPAPELTADERALLEAIDVTGLPAAAATRSSARLAPAATLGRPAPERQSDVGQGQAPLAQLAQQYTLPAPFTQAEPDCLPSAVSTGASSGRHASSAAASAHGSHAELAHAYSLEHALHLAAEAAMGGDSQLARSGGGPSSSSGGGGSTGGTPSSAGPASRASTSRQASVARWDSQTLHRAGSSALSARSRHSSDHLPGALCALCGIGLGSCRRWLVCVQ